MAEIITYTTERGKSEVDEGILELSTKSKKGDKKADTAVRSIFFAIEMYESGMPHSRQLRGQLYEIRASRYRITYFRWRGKLVLLTMFLKRTQQTPIREITRAEERMKDWINRYGK